MGSCQKFIGRKFCTLLIIFSWVDIFYNKINEEIERTFILLLNSLHSFALVDVVCACVISLRMLVTYSVFWTINMYLPALLGQNSLVLASPTHSKHYRKILTQYVQLVIGLFYSVVFLSCVHEDFAFLCLQIEIIGIKELPFTMLLFEEYLST